MSFKVVRTHEICAGHRVVGHESKCRHLHGHNYVFHFHVEPKNILLQTDFAASTELDQIGRVIDFSVVKSTLCEWLEQNWDHKFLHWNEDPLIKALTLVHDEYVVDHHVDVGCAEYRRDVKDLADSLVPLPFNPTAENLAAYMVNVIGPRLLDGHGVQLVRCVIEETSKCHVEYNL